MLDLSSSTTRRAKRGLLREWRLHALSVFSLSVAFVCLAAALLVVTNLQAIEQRWAHAGRASIYLKDEATSADVSQLKEALTKVPGVTSVRYVSSGQARDAFTKDEDQKSALAALPAEAFPASLEVDVARDVNDEGLTDIVTKLEKLPAVDGVETYQSWTERLARLVRGGVAASAILAVIVLLSVLAVVGSTMRFALQRRRAEVEVLRLVGATDRFVKAPFVVEGSLQGALGAASAVAILGALFFVVHSRFDAELALLIGIEPRFFRGRSRSGWSRWAPCSARRLRRSVCASWCKCETRRARRARRFVFAMRRSRVTTSRERRPEARATTTSTALELAALDRKSPTSTPRSKTRRKSSKGSARTFKRPTRARGSRGRALYKLTRAGMLPIGGGFDALMRHAMDVEHARHALERDLEPEKRLRAHGADRRAFARARRARSRVARVGNETRWTRRASRWKTNNDVSTRSRAHSTIRARPAMITSSSDAVQTRRARTSRVSRRRAVGCCFRRGQGGGQPAHREGTDGPGVEVLAQMGTPVRAVFAGKVAFADRYGAYGRIVILDHGEHYYSVSGNLGSIDVKIGDTLAPGERIGTVGDSDSGSMLYFEIRHGSQTIAPGPWLGL